MHCIDEWFSRSVLLIKLFYYELMRTEYIIGFSYRSVHSIVAFISFTDYEWDSNLYSSWTESIWSQENLLIRMFLVPSKKQEVCQ